MYLETVEEHVAIVRRVLEELRDPGLCVHIDKSSFHVTEVEYLGYRISDQDISISNENTQVVIEWPVPKDVKGVQAFLGFANFYRWYIQEFSKICKPLTNLLLKVKN